MPPGNLQVQAGESMRRPQPATHSSAGDVYLDLLKQALLASLYDESAWQVIGTPRLAHNALRRSWKTSQLRHKLRALQGNITGQPLADKRRQASAPPALKASILMRPYDREAREGGTDRPMFGYTMVGRKRLDNLQACIEDVIARNVPGDLIETGVWRGGATILMRAVLKLHGVTDRIVHVADSFQGLPPPTDAADGWDLTGDAGLAVSVDQVQRNFERFGLLDEQVKFLVGWFADTLPKAPIDRLSILRLDGDLYSSTMDALSALYPKVSSGGYVIVDDYGSWPACKRAVDEYIARHCIVADIKAVDTTGVYWRVEKNGAG